MISKTIVILCCIASILESTFACNGYKAKFLKVENCAGDDAIITIDPNFSIKLNKQCELVPTGCVNNKPFTTAVSSFKIVKDGVVLKDGKMDLCSVAEKATDEMKDMLKLFGAPPNCPVPEEKICANDHKVNISKYKPMLGMVKGNIVIDSNIQHDTGKSCFHIEMEISKG